MVSSTNTAHCKSLKSNGIQQAAAPGGHGTASVVDDAGMPSDLGTAPKGSGKKLMLSGRFDGGEKERVLRAVGTRLEALGEKVLVVSASAGQSFGPMTMEYLGQRYVA